MVTERVDQLAELSTQYMLSEPAANILIIGVVISLFPLFYKRDALSWVESVRKNLKVTEVILVVSAITALYLSTEQLIENLVREAAIFILAVVVASKFGRVLDQVTGNN